MDYSTYYNLALRGYHNITGDYIESANVGNLTAPYLPWCHENGIDVTRCVADAVRRTFPGKYSLHDIFTGMDKAYRALDAGPNPVP